MATTDTGPDSPGIDAGDCGDHCATVLADVWRFLDDELDPERRATVQRHLDECSPCLEEAGIDTKLKALLARKCGGDHAPEELRQRIVSQLVAWRGDGVTGAVASVTVTSRRDVRGD
jgi:mycothiol system anti-sigma-R factor